MDELYMNEIEADSFNVHRLSRTRSDSNSVTIDAAEFDQDIQELLHSNQHAFLCFSSLYEDFKMDRISMSELYTGLQGLCLAPTAREILEIVKLSCPIEKYPEIEQFLELTAQGSDAEERKRYERDLTEQYTLLQTQLEEIDYVASDHQKGLRSDHIMNKALRKIRKNCLSILREIRHVMKDEECGYTVNRIDEFKAAIDMLTVQLQDKLHHCNYLEDDYDPLLDDDSINEMIQKNHDWVVSTIKTSTNGELKKKRFTLFPRSQRSIEVHCQANDYLMCFWQEDDQSRLLFDAYYTPDGRGKEMEVVPLLVRVSKYCFLFHSAHSGNLTLRWNNKLSFQKRKHLHSYIRRFKSCDGKIVFEEYDSHHYEMLDVQSKFLSKLSIEGGDLTIKASSACQREDGVNYVTTCYWRNDALNARVSWEVSHTWEEWKDIYLYMDYIMHNKVKELTPFPKAHILMTTLLIDDRLNGLNRYIQGMMKDSKIMNSYEVNKFFKITSHIRRERCAVLCLAQQHDGERVIREKIIEESEERLSFSPVEATLTDPLSYLTSR